MKKIKVKDEQLLIKLTARQKQEIRNLSALSGKTMSEYILHKALKPDLGEETENLFTLMKNHFGNVDDFQIQQQETIYIIMQFIMFMMSQHKSIDEIMAFYEDASQKAKKKFSERN